MHVLQTAGTRPPRRLSSLAKHPPCISLPDSAAIPARPKTKIRATKPLQELLAKYLRSPAAVLPLAELSKTPSSAASAVHKERTRPDITSLLRARRQRYSYCANHKRHLTNPQPVACIECQTTEETPTLLPSLTPDRRRRCGTIAHSPVQREFRLGAGRERQRVRTRLAFGNPLLSRTVIEDPISQHPERRRGSISGRDEPRQQENGAINGPTELVDPGKHEEESRMLVTFSRLGNAAPLGATMDREENDGNRLQVPEKKQNCAFADTVKKYFLLAPSRSFIGNVSSKDSLYSFSGKEQIKVDSPVEAGEEMRRITKSPTFDTSLLKENAARDTPRLAGEGSQPLPHRAVSPKSKREILQAFSMSGRHAGLWEREEAQAAELSYRMFDV